VLHIAAQKDHAFPIIYFHEKGVDINSVDKRNSTPLHWACYLKSEQAFSYLLSLGPQLSLQDELGYTPLHLSVLTLPALGHTRFLRKLLVKGADRNVEDLKGRKAKHLLKEGNAPKELQTEAKGLLKEPSRINCCLFKE